MTSHKDTEGDEPIVISLAQFAKRVPEIIRRMNEDNRSVIITRKGRFVAKITPLAHANVESNIISEMIDELDEDKRNEVLGITPVPDIYTTEEMFALLKERDGEKTEAETIEVCQPDTSD